MTLDQIRTLVDYHCWARDRLLDAVAMLTPEQFTHHVENSFPSVRATLLHLYGAESVWIARWHGEAPSTFPDVSHLTDLAALRSAWQREEERLRALVERLGEAGVTRPVTYRGFDGRDYRQPFWEVLQHVVSHGAYHRGQVTMMLRQLGVKTAKPMDLLVYLRETGAAARG